MTKQDSASLLDRVVVRSSTRPLPAAVQYVLASGLVIAVAALRFLLVTSQLPWLLFIPAIFCITLLTGRRPGLLAAMLSTLLGAASIGSIRDPWWLSGAQWTSCILFVLVTSALVMLTDALRRSMLRVHALNQHLAEGRLELADRQGFLSSVLASSTDCIKVLDLAGRLTFMTENGQAIMEVSDFNRVAGCPWPDFWRGEGNAEALAAIDAARDGRSSSFVGHAATMGGNGKWWHVAVSPILGADGRPERILSVSRDITALRQSEEQRDHYVRIIENSTDFIGMAWLDGSMFFLNPAGCRLVGLRQEEVARIRIEDLFRREQAAAIANEIIPAVEQHGHWTGERTLRRFDTGEPIPVLCTAFPVQDADGRLIGFGTVTRDISEQKRAEERQAILNGEIAHRLKNTLAIVQSISNMTLRKVVPPDELMQFNERLQALARSHDLLCQDGWRTSGLDDLAYGVLDDLGIGGRCRFSGPPVRFGARAAMSTSLLLHELATNAIKYGALSVPEGMVAIDWHLETGADSGVLMLEWRESGGPPVLAPNRKGFGSRLLSLGLVGTGGAELRYRHDGLVASFRAEMSKVEEA